MISELNWNVSMYRIGIWWDVPVSRFASVKCARLQVQSSSGFTLDPQVGPTKTLTKSCVYCELNYLLYHRLDVIIGLILSVNHDDKWIRISVPKSM